MGNSLVTLLIACCIIAAFSAASSSNDAVCASPTNCVRPVPRPAPPSSSLDVSKQHIRCHLSCISEQNIEIQILDNNTSWPSHSYASLPCTSQQKVDQCTLGCMTKHISPGLTVNRCRDQCASECEKRRTANKGSVCNGSCRRTFCRYGCSMYQSIQNERHDVVLSTPTTAPDITKNNSSWKLYTTNTSNSMPAEQTRPNDTDIIQTVSYLYRVQRGSETLYMWQKDLRMPLDFSPFSCEEIQVSFLVMSKRGVSEFSPSLSLCVHGVGGWPSGVEETSIVIRYMEDTRESYLGYSTANISWTKPNNNQFLTSYSIYVHTTSNVCGGVNGVYSFNKINKDATWFVLSAKQQNGVPKFGCSYQISIVSMPENTNQSRPLVTMAPALEEPDPTMSLECRRKWDERGFINISVDWVLSSLNPLPAIKIFRVNTRLVNTTRPGLFGWLTNHHRSFRIPPEEERVNYNITLTDLEPQIAPEIQYKIEVRVERSSQYHWRRVPRTETCIVSGEAEQPAVITHVKISDLEVTNSGHELNLNLSWSPPSPSNGDLKKYKVEVVTEFNSSYSEKIFQSVYNASQLSTRLNISANTSSCLYAKVRSSNGYRWSEWSKPLLIPYNQGCQSNSTSYPSSTDESVTLFYQRTGEEAVKITELSCSLNNTKSESLSQTLLELQEKLDTIPDTVTVENTTETLLERLRNIERKVDQLLNAASDNTNSEE